MGMYDTIYAELDCPFCGKQYRYSPMTSERAAQELREHKQWHIETREKHLRGEKEVFYMQDLWAEQEGFDDVDKWINQLDSLDNIEAHRTRPHLGLAEIQTKEFEKVLKEFYVGDEVPKYSGHYFIPESFECDGCSSADKNVYVKVWLEIEERKLKAVLTRDPETGKPAREVFKQTPSKPREPDPHPPLYFKHRGIQAQAKYNPKTEQYDLKVHYLPERFSLSHPDTELLREIFTSFAENYLYLLGKGYEKQESLHEHLHAICCHLPSDYQPYGQRERTGPDCSCGCKHFLKLPGKLGMDWGVCANPDSPRTGLLTFEHQGCEQFEAALY